MHFVVAFLLYGGIQAYFAVKVVQAFQLTGAARLLVAAVALLMTVGPLLLWRVERCADCHGAAVVGAWLIYGWMGFSFLFFWLGVVHDTYGFAVHLLGGRVLSYRRAFGLLAAAASVLWLYGFHAARHPVVEHLDIRSDKFPSGFQGLRIVQISDAHLGVLIGRQGLDAILDQVAALHPDVLVSTGDLVDAQAQFVDGLSNRIRDRLPGVPKFAVTGNHEFYAGLDHSVDFHLRAGFTLLRGQQVDLGDNITLIGIDDPAVLAGKTGEAGLLAGIPASRFVILLKHQPVVVPGARFDLQLSGHTHNGQIFPFTLLVQRVYPMIRGLYHLANGGELYVSRGTGTWGPPIRVLAPAEITLITLSRP